MCGRTTVLLSPNVTGTNITLILIGVAVCSVKCLRSRKLWREGAILDIASGTDGNSVDAENIVELGKTEKNVTLLLPVFPCKTCEKLFSTQDLLDAHLQRRHPQELPVFHRCNFCPFSCDDVSTVTKHERIHLEKLHVCQFCQKTFTQLAYLKKHILNHTTERQHKCTVCGDRFRHVSSLKTHCRRQHGGDDSAPHVCPDCGQRFYIKGGLDRHMLTHMRGNKAHGCSLCGERFYFKDDVDKHMLIHGGENKPHACSQCGKTFKELWHIRSHEKLVHNLQHSPGDEESNQGFIEMVEVKEEPLSD